MTVVSDYTALLSGYATFTWSPVVGRSAFVTYSFEQSASDYLAVYGYSQAARDSIVPFSAAALTEARNAIALWGAACGLVFLEVQVGTGDIRFTNLNTALTSNPSAAFAYNPSTFISEYSANRLDIGGDVFVNTAFSSQHLFNHEIGHALGLKHPFFSDGASPTLDPALDNVSQTVMSYTGFATGALGPLDIQAAQYLYGTTDGQHLVSWNWNAGTATLTQNDGDDGDTLLGTAVRDVINGWGGNDQLYGFEGDDALSGGAGSDVFAGGPGNNVLDGLAGRDIALYSSLKSDVTTTRISSNWWTVTGDGFSDTLFNVEALKFLDGLFVLRQPAPSDMTGDAISDIVWFNSASRLISFYEVGSGGGYIWRDIGGVGAGYSPLIGDFNGDGDKDILWFNSAEGRVSYYDVNPSGGYTWHNIGMVSPGFTPFVGDFSGDGTSDIAWFNATTRAISYYEINLAGGYTWRDMGTAPSQFTPLGVGDFDGNGWADILWKTPSGQLYFGGNGYTFLGTVSSGFTALVGDFSGDRISDIAWFNASTGAISYYEVHETGGYTWRNIGSAAPGFSPDVGDFNGDGDADLLWTNSTTGSVSYYDVNPAGGYTWHNIGLVGPGYDVVA